MPITFQFSSEKSLITLTITDPWTVGELDQVYESEKPIFDAAGDVKVNTLVDIRNMHSIPPRALTRRNSPNITHPNSGRVVVVGANAFARNLASAAFNLAGFDKAQFVATLEEARAYLESAS